MELAQESKIILIKTANVVDPVLDHSQALDTHSKCPTAIDIWVIADIAKNIWVNHARAEDLDPASLLANAAALS